ncbi:MAG: ATP-binding cassette domain-containing protein [Candidatus Dormibacteria bacterium]
MTGPAGRTVARVYGRGVPGTAAAALEELRAFIGRSDARAWTAALVLLVLVPGLAGSEVARAAAHTALLLLSVYGVYLVTRLTAQPTLGQAGFMATGAYISAWLVLSHGFGFLSAALIAAGATALLGLGLGWVAARGGPALSALTTWAFGWLVVLAIAAAPGATGGTAGLALPPPRLAPPGLGVSVNFSPLGQLAVAAILLAATVLLLDTAQRSPVGRAWAALRDSPAIAAALGHRVVRVRVAAASVAAALGALSGALLSSLDGVVDPTRFDPTASLALLVAVLVGSRAGLVGPAIGLLVAITLPDTLGGLLVSSGLAPGTVRGVITAAVSVLALALLASYHRSGSGSRAPGLLALAPATERRAAVPARAGPPGDGEEPVNEGGTLEVRDLSLRFGGVQALRAVSLSLAPASITGLLGPNGSGKSTLLRCISGTVSPDSGLVTLAGRSLDGLNEGDRVAAGVVRTFQRTATFEDLTCREHVLAGMHWLRAGPAWAARALTRTPGYRAARLTDAVTAQGVLETVGLGEHADSLPSALSAGRRRLLQLAAALGAGPAILLLDEPAAGMAPDELDLLEEALAHIRAAGTSILVVEHNLAFLARACERVVALVQGEVVSAGTPDEVLSDPRLVAAYLGSHATH